MLPESVSPLDVHPIRRSTAAAQRLDIPLAALRDQHRPGLARSKSLHHMPDHRGGLFPPAPPSPIARARPAGEAEPVVGAAVGRATAAPAEDLLDGYLRRSEITIAWPSAPTRSGRVQ